MTTPPIQLKVLRVFLQTHSAKRRQEEHMHLLEHYALMDCSHKPRLYTVLKKRQYYFFSCKLNNMSCPRGMGPHSIKHARV